MNLTFSEQRDQLFKIINVLDKKMKESQNEDDRTEIKGLLLRQQLEKKMLNIILEAVKSEENIKQLKNYEEDLNKYLGNTFGTLG